jgi:hypothetical protein
LIYQLRLKSIAIEAHIEAIVSENREIVIRSEALEHADRFALKRKLGDQTKVQRRDVRLAPRPEAVWRSELMETLEAIRDLVD